MGKVRQKNTKSKGNTKVTPLMQQYAQVKAKYPDAILLFRVGDFYETFGEDAVKAAKILGIVLTSRNNGGSDVELAGFPFHSLDTYLPKLVKAGYRVAICEQLEPPSKHKKIVKRGVTEMVTPGVVIGDNLLNHRENNFLAVFNPGPKNLVGVAFLDISTGEFFASEGQYDYVMKLIQSFAPSEILLPKSKISHYKNRISDNVYIFPLDDWVFTEEYGLDKILSHFQLSNLKGFGIDDLNLAKIAAGAVIHYLGTTENTQLQHIRSIRRIHEKEYVWLDRFTIRNLELLQSTHEGGVPLIEIIDHTVSPMGARMLRKWMMFPLVSIAAIQKRLNIVAWFFEHPDQSRDMEAQLHIVGDLERLVSRIAVGKINPREILQIRRALEALKPIQELLHSSQLAELVQVAAGIKLCEAISKKINDILQEDPPVNILKGNVIASGVSEELDETRNIIQNSKELLLEIQQTEAQKTGITNLKIGFNNVFGYYLEVTNKYKDQGLIPDHWIRKQTLTNAERYISDELKKLETKILGAEEKVSQLELAIYQNLVNDLLEYVEPFQQNARLVARIDCLLSFATAAKKNRYAKPIIDDGLQIEIKDGRHPVIEKQLPLGEQYVPNDLEIHNEEQQILMITGPNMSGKSAVLRQTALICLMAQMGSFVPASYARIGYLDKIYTRVGASDNISSGESTFMVEMNETSNILNNITERSLILLDEIGRGTSTYDGISIAWSIAEYLHENTTARPKTLFATHYHELNDLTRDYHRIKNYNVSIKEVGNRIIFLRKLVEGGSSHSFGIHVAKMAGMPPQVIERANQILKQLEARTQSGKSDSNIEKTFVPPQSPVQLNIFESKDPLWEMVYRELTELDLNTMTPIESMLALNKILQIISENEK